MTTPFIAHTWEECPAINSLKLLSGKWKANIFLLATFGPVRFNSLLRQLPSANKQSLSIALREMEQAGLLDKVIVKKKPLHIEYHLTEKGRSVIDVLRNLENIKIQHLAEPGGMA
jgi:DNA-binding HxlR family transcriptional regulator